MNSQYMMNTDGQPPAKPCLQSQPDELDAIIVPRLPPIYAIDVTVERSLSGIQCDANANAHG
ncbi:hypothetical protein BLA29_001208 [Euroglyphus maynei]|uniref:Uncharacterized protein n=1 Tax=Euroglyphus maynei TaxID=6958 RepID=A0A1Y3BT42_EURMA|nr:hypothetical protein BLA29_001208 [Euroglyphus maynei]